MLRFRDQQLRIVCCCLFLLATVAYAQKATPTPPKPTAPTPESASAPAPVPALASAPAPDTLNLTTPKDEDISLKNCLGVFLEYVVIEPPERIYPFLDNKSQHEQPYRFKSEVTLTNTGYEKVLGWEVYIGFQHDEIIAQADGVLFSTGDSPPGIAVGNGTSVLGSDMPDLQTSIDTAMDPTKIGYTFQLTGTEFGVAEPDFPLPTNISLVNQGWECGKPSKEDSPFSPANRMWVCCAENRTAMNDTKDLDSGFLPRVEGDIVMYYDVYQTYGDNYWAKVTISMEDPLGRLDFWNLTWDWKQGEFIFAMKGAQTFGPQEQDKCVLGKAGEHYGSLDFSQVMSCSSSPTIVDLTEDQRNNPQVGIPNCCRNGTLLPELVDPSQTKSEFQLQVYKLPPHIDRNDIQPPINWNIGDGYKCSQPRAVSPSEFSPDSIYSQTAVSSWQVVCNKTVSPVKKCCVSFSTFYNDSVIPCPTCSCGCQSNTLPWNHQKCNPHIDAMFLPYNGVLLPPSNRTALGLQLAKLDHYTTPDPVPCPDNCGVALNWHVYSDYADGWSARITIFNWEKEPVPKWFAAIDLPKAMPGYQNVYTFNGSVVPSLDDALLMQGHNGYSNDYLLGLDNTDNPGKLQSLMSFDKRKTPGISVVKGDGFPQRVWFNGEECAIPSQFPLGSGAWQGRPSVQLSFVVVLVTIVLLLGDATRQL
ncbi:hypothetical protein R1sor_002975 [Riccia sorocarpa]|uniref:COBRA C-terminal domain-containing protein n=1 Tax=Riccia sorocarpa TaxID=122646 RepID=A0ABD3H142_9MARC